MRTHSEVSSQQLFIALTIISFTLGGAILISQASISFTFIVIIGLIVAVFAFLNTEFALLRPHHRHAPGPTGRIKRGGSEGVRGRGLTLLRVDDFLFGHHRAVLVFEIQCSEGIGSFFSDTPQFSYRPILSRLRRLHTLRLYDGPHQRNGGHFFCPEVF